MSLNHLKKVLHSNSMHECPTNKNYPQKLKSILKKPTFSNKLEKQLTSTKEQSIFINTGEITLKNSLGENEGKHFYENINSRQFQSISGFSPQITQGKDNIFVIKEPASNISQRRVSFSTRKKVLLIPSTRKIFQPINHKSIFNPV